MSANFLDEFDGYQGRKPRVAPVRMGWCRRSARSAPGPMCVSVHQKVARNVTAGMRHGTGYSWRMIKTVGLGVRALGPQRRSYFPFIMADSTERRSSSLVGDREGCTFVRLGPDWCFVFAG
ncbi:MAG: hypothetical protein U9N87_11955, partial [Planctomycetota bacterium]|nr:hypothetical protein [Planctomycetota bacterium]